MTQRVTRGAGGRPQLRSSGTKTRASWSATRRDLFLEHLAVSCNVAASCRKAKLSDTLVYARRKKDAGFRVSWARALAEAVERLEMMLLERAMNGKVVEKTRSGETVRTIEYPDHIAMALIRVHKDNAAPDEDDDEETLAALRAKISRKLDIVARREAARERAAATDAAGGADVLPLPTGKGHAKADRHPKVAQDAEWPVRERAPGRDARGRFVPRGAAGRRSQEVGR